MLLPQQHYPGFSGATHVEYLFVALAREILNLQKNPNNNPTSIEIVSFSSDEAAETFDISLFDCLGKISDQGVIEVVNPFVNLTFGAGAGAYPYNRANPLDALFHLGLYILSLLKDSEDTRDIFSVDLTSTEVGNNFTFTLSLEATDYPTGIFLPE